MNLIQPGFLNRPQNVTQKTTSSKTSLSPDVIKANQRSYKKIIEYLNENEIARLETGMKEVKNSEEITDKIHLAQWEELFKDETFPYQALACLREGLISAQEFSTSQMFFNVYTHPNNHGKAQIIPIFVNNKRTKQAKSMIDATMQLASSSFKAYLDAFIGTEEGKKLKWLTDKAIENWQKMRGCRIKRLE